MAQEIGTAYVTIQPSGRGFGRAIEGEIDGGVSRGTKKADRSMLASFAKWGRRATVVAAAAITAFTIKGGISRLMAIDDAEGKLRGLGYSAKQISVVMDNALAAVKGTAFGLGDAATAAASATAAGIKPGKELEKYLRLIGDAATIGGTSFTEMGAIINKTTSRGKVGMENLNQLSERGIPIMEWLAKEYGVSGEALTKMVSKGQVDAKTFRKVINDNIGGAALESGNTFRGAMSNLGASLGRIGAGLAGGVFKSLGPAAKNLTKALAPLEKNAAKVGEAIGEWVRTDGAAIFNKIKSAVKALAPTVVSLATGLGVAIGWLVDNKESVAGFVAVLATYKTVVAAITAATKAWAVIQAILNGTLLSNPIGLVVVAIAALVAGLIYAYKNSETFREIVDAAFSAIKAVAIAVFGFVAAYIKTQITIAKKILTGIWTAVKAVIGFFGSLWSAVKSAVGSIGKKVGEIKSKVTGALKGAKDWLLDAGKDIMRGLRDGIEAGFSWIRDKLSGVGKLIPGWLKKVLGISSPSKVMANEIGRWILPGVSVGVDKTVPAFRRDMLAAMDIPSIGSPGGLSIAGGVGPAFANGVAASGPVVNQTNIMQPGMSAEEMGRAAANRLLWVMTS